MVHLRSRMGRLAEERVAVDAVVMRLKRDMTVLSSPMVETLPLAMELLRSGLWRMQDGSASARASAASSKYFPSWAQRYS